MRNISSTLLLLSVALWGCPTQGQASVPAGEPKGLADVKAIFAYYDGYFDAYQKKELAALSGCWATDFTILSPDDGVEADKKQDRARAIKILKANLDYKGKYTNGPDEIFLTSITAAADKITVKGYSGGSSRMLSKNDELVYSDYGDGRRDVGGVSYEELFEDVWTKTASGWVLAKRTVHYKEFTDNDYNGFKAAHAKLKKQYGG